MIKAKFIFRAVDGQSKKVYLVSKSMDKLISEVVQAADAERQFVEFDYVLPETTVMRNLKEYTFQDLIRFMSKDQIADLQLCIDRVRHMLGRSSSIRASFMVHQYHDPSENISGECHRFDRNVSYHEALHAVNSQTRGMIQDLGYIKSQPETWDVTVRPYFAKEGKRYYLSRMGQFVLGTLASKNKAEQARGLSTIIRCLVPHGDAGIASFSTAMPVEMANLINVELPQDVKSHGDLIMTHYQPIFIDALNEITRQSGVIYTYDIVIKKI